MDNDPGGGVGTPLQLRRESRATLPAVGGPGGSRQYPDHVGAESSGFDPIHLLDISRKIQCRLMRPRPISQAEVLSRRKSRAPALTGRIRSCPQAGMRPDS